MANPKKPPKSKQKVHTPDLQNNIPPISLATPSSGDAVPIWGSHCPDPRSGGWDIVKFQMPFAAGTLDRPAYVISQTDNPMPGQPGHWTVDDSQKLAIAFGGDRTVLPHVHAFKIVPPAGTATGNDIYMLRVMGNPCHSAIFKVTA